MAFNKARTNQLLAGDRTSSTIDEIMLLNIGLVHAQLSSFKLMDDQDACSFALDGLYKAVLSYDNSNAAGFSTYATVCIRNSIRQSIRNNKENVQVYSLHAMIDCIGEAIYKNSALVEKEDKLVSKETESNLHRKIAEVLSEAPPSAASVLKCWIDSDYSLINKEIAERLDVSQPYVNKVINSFRAKLAAKLKEV